MYYVKVKSDLLLYNLYIYVYVHVHCTEIHLYITCVFYSERTTDKGRSDGKLFLSFNFLPADLKK